MKVETIHSHKKPLVVALLGNPNSGKSTLFNLLTGSSQKIGNWAGVTVEQRSALCKKTSRPLQIVDLPGCYTLGSYFESFEESDTSLDEKIAQSYIASRQSSIILNVIDVNHLERHLNLTLQLIEQNLPFILVLTKIDLFKKTGGIIDIEKLTILLNRPCVAVDIAEKNTLEHLKEVIIKFETRNDPHCLLQPSSEISEMSQISQSSLLYHNEDIHEYNNKANNANRANKDDNKDKKEKGYDPLEKSHQHYQRIQTIIKEVWVQKETGAKIQNTITEKIDNIVLNRFAGLPIFFMMMYFTFVCTIQVGGALQDYFENYLQYVCIDSLFTYLVSWHWPGWLIEIVAKGFGQGLMTTLSFIPIVGCMFFCLSILETTGYMARAAFVMDKIMQSVGLSGKSFIPMILGFGCNVPAILASRTLQNRHERILTILMTPFMSCGARLAIYALFVSVFFKDNGHNIIFALYLIGIAIALFLGLILRKTIKKQNNEPFILELPRYQWPNLLSIFKTVRFRLTKFVIKAAIIIIPLCGVLSGFSAFKTENEDSWLIHLSKSITPLFSPMGIEVNNWPATLGLLTGVLAKEVVVGTLNATYMQSNRVTSTESTSHLDSLYLGSSYTSTTDTSTSPNTSAPQYTRSMAESFGGKINAFAYLLFVLLYFPCVSVLAVIARELSLSWAMVTALFTSGLAYSVAVLFYQSATVSLHPGTSLSWIIGMLVALILLFWSLRQWTQKNIHQGSKRVYRALPTQILILE